MDYEIDGPAVVTEIADIHALYENALAHNDLDTLDRLFWNDPRTLRYGPNGTLLGHAAISAFRRGRKNGAPSRKNEAARGHHHVRPGFCCGQPGIDAARIEPHQSAEPDLGAHGRGLAHRRRTRLRRA
jgi:hypothetical protein